MVRRKPPLVIVPDDPKLMLPLVALISDAFSKVTLTLKVYVPVAPVSATICGVPQVPFSEM